jgi:pyruvate dehydrogenase E2 component (dihydrolipoamide acetyltransferase)
VKQRRRFITAIIGKGEDISALLAEGEATATEDSKEKSTDEAQRRYKQEDAPTKSAALPKGVVVVTMPRLSDTMTEWWQPG